jgi:hypothetical protein
MLGLKILNVLIDPALIDQNVKPSIMSADWAFSRLRIQDNEGRYYKTVSDGSAKFAERRPLPKPTPPLKNVHVRRHQKAAPKDYLTAGVAAIF